MVRNIKTNKLSAPEDEKEHQKGFREYALPRIKEELDLNKIPYEITQIDYYGDRLGDELKKFHVDIHISLPTAKDLDKIKLIIEDIMEEEFGPYPHDYYYDLKIIPDIESNKDIHQLQFNFGARKASLNPELVSILELSFQKFLKGGMQNVFNKINAICTLDTDSLAKKNIPCTFEYGFSLSTDSKIQFYYMVNFSDKYDYYKLNTLPFEDVIDIGYGNSSSYNLVSDRMGEYLAKYLTDFISGVVIKVTSSKISSKSRDKRNSNRKMNRHSFRNVNRIHDNTWEALTSLMNDDYREQVNIELSPCTNMDFLERYLELDPDFEMVIEQEFPELL